MNSVVMIVIQKVPHWSRVDWSNVFCLFRSQYREIRYMRSLLECLWVTHTIANLDHKFLLLSCRKCWGEGWILPVASLSVSVCEFTQILVRLLGCSMVSTGFSMDSMTFVYLRSSFFNCIEKKGKFRIWWRLSSIVLLRRKNTRSIKGLARFVKTIFFSLNVMSPASNCNSTVAIGASDCPLATIFWNSDAGPSFIFVCGTSNRNLRKSASEMAADNAPKSNIWIPEIH